MTDLSRYTAMLGHENAAKGPWGEWLRTLPSDERQLVCELAADLLPGLVSQQHTRYAVVQDGAAITSALRIAAGFYKQIGLLSNSPLPSDMPELPPRIQRRPKAAPPP